MAVTTYTIEEYRDTMTFLRDIVSDYRNDKPTGFAVLSLLLNDPKLKTRVRTHMETFYPKGLVKGYVPCVGQ